jgi:flagellar motor switch protein FliN/FliY
MLDVVCRVDVVLGTGSITVRDFLKLQRLSVVRLAQSAGSDLEVRVHGVPAAAGEVVIIDDSTALRVTEVTPLPGGASGA